MKEKEQATAQAVWRQYSKAEEYNQNLDLYETVRQNEDMYIGDQWKGVNAPDLERPALNFLKRVVSYFVAMLVTDDVGVSLTPMAGVELGEETCAALARSVEWVIERCKIKTLHREHLRGCAVDGDGAIYFHYDPNIPNGQPVQGEICAELLENTKVLFGNPHVWEVQKQPYILLVQRMTVEQARAIGRAANCSQEDLERIQPDDSGDRYGEAGSANDLVTVLIRLRKDEKGRVLAMKTTQNVVLEAEKDSLLRLYPVAWMSWDRVRGSYHGQSAIKPILPNQLYVNKVWAMAMMQVKRMAFPTVLYDRTKIINWTNQVGRAIQVMGDPNLAVATGFRPPDMSAQVFQLVDQTIAYTKELMGASDAALGNVKPDNTSAIIAVQKASAAPLELQRLAFYQWVEDYVRIILDHIRAHYGVRAVSVPQDGGEAQNMAVDFSRINYDLLQLRVDVGAASYWSELMQIQTMDNLFSKGIVTDAITYLESVPDAYLHGKNKLIQKLREQQEEQQMMEQMAALGAEGGALNAVPQL